MNPYLHIGGLVAVGFDATGKYLLTVSHSGRGIFSTNTWERVARCSEVAYPNGGISIGIGPVAGEKISVSELNYDVGETSIVSPCGRFTLNCESSGIEVK